MTKGIGKRAYHKREMNDLKRRAMIIGGVVAGVSLVMIIFSLFLFK